MAKETTKIEDYGFLSDTQTGALVSRDGCVDWLCFPRFDSGACFASLLGEAKNGHWRFWPNDKIDKTSRRYRDETLILETEIETQNGAVLRFDFGFQNQRFVAIAPACFVDFIVRPKPPVSIFGFA